MLVWLIKRYSNRYRYVLHVLTECSETHLSLFYSLERYKFFFFSFLLLAHEYFLENKWCFVLFWFRIQIGIEFGCYPLSFRSPKLLTLTCLTLAHALINSPIISQKLPKSLGSPMPSPVLPSFICGFPPLSILLCFLLSLSLSLLLPRAGL